MKYSPTWDYYFLHISEAVARKSKDPSTRVGAVIVGQDNEIVSTGYNGFPRGITDSSERLEDRPTKYKYIVHAEANAIYNAVRGGRATRDCCIYVAGLPPCHECAKAIIQAGIVRVVHYDGFVPDSWMASVEFGQGILNEARIGVVCLKQ